MQNLYHQMKDALVFFGLRFGDMDKVSVKISKKQIVFIYMDMEVRYTP